MPAESPLRDRRDPGYDLIETMRWEPESGFQRLERHLARLYRSARQLGFDCDVEAVGRALGTVMSDDPQRVRLLLNPRGGASLTAQPYLHIPEGAVWKLRIAATRLESGDTLLRHKTTRRDLYNRARGEFALPHADEVLLMNERGEVCEGTITTLFVDDRSGGPLLTPALDCGLLAGVLRAEMIEAGLAVEARLTPADLGGTARLFVGNSLRGLITASLVPASTAGAR
jgi:4-amino-4-deoxychorismate lyase